jgi:hypothetical protein
MMRHLFNPLWPHYKKRGGNPPDFNAILIVRRHPQWPVSASVARTLVGGITDYFTWNSTSLVAPSEVLMTSL